jgi:hypothetical protein
MDPTPSPKADRERRLLAFVLDRVVYRVCYWTACRAGAVAVVLARGFRGLGRRSIDYGPVVILAQLPVVLLWVPARMLFLASAAPCFAIARRGAAP